MDTNVETGQKDVVMLCVIVDDFIVTRNSQEALDGFKDSIRKVWSITDFGALEWCVNTYSDTTTTTHDNFMNEVWPNTS